MKKFGIILFLALFCFTFSSLAQEEVLIDITKTDKQLENIELLVKKQNVSSKELSEQLKIINELQIQINQAKSVYQQKKESIQNWKLQQNKTLYTPLKSSEIGKRYYILTSRQKKKYKSCVTNYCKSLWA